MTRKIDSSSRRRQRQQPLTAAIADHWAANLEQRYRARSRRLALSHLTLGDRAADGATNFSPPTRW